MRNKLLLFVSLLFNLIVFAQINPPDVSRFLQINTYNGGQLSHVISDINNNTYMSGIANGENYSFDDYSFEPVGHDDLYLIKTSPSGQNLWLKTVNAGTNGVIGSVKTYINSVGEIFATGSFKGSITFSNTTVDSEVNSYFILKYNSSGSEKWITTFASKIVDISFGDQEVFAASSHSLYVINENDGSLNRNRDFEESLLKINTIEKSTSEAGKLYIGGICNTSGVVDNLNLIKNTGFILYGNLDFEFSFSASFNPDVVNDVSEVYDIKTLDDGSIGVVGLSNGLTKFEGSTGIISDVNNPENYMGRGYYLFTAKISQTLITPDWFRTSTQPDGFFRPTFNLLDELEIFPYKSIGASTNAFKVLFKKKQGYGRSYMLPNGITVNDKEDGILFNCEYSDGSSNSSQYSYTMPLGFVTINANGMMLSYHKNSIFSVSSLMNPEPNFVKHKNDSNFGSLTSQYIKHVETDGSLISYTYQCGKTNYFGLQINNTDSSNFPAEINCSNILSKIAPNGQTVWTSQLIGTSQSRMYPSRYGNIADTNSEGENVIVSQFIDEMKFVDNNSVETNITRQNNTISNYITLIANTNSDGSLKWAKKIEPTLERQAITYSSVTYDDNGNVIIAGSARSAYLIDNVAYNYNNNTILFLAKLDAATGNVLYMKQFSDIEAAMFNLEIDDENNIYLAFEPYIYEWGITSYNFGTVEVQLSDSGNNYLFLKFDTNGNTLLAKNYYEDSALEDYSYSWPLSLKFNGTDFIISGEMYSETQTEYKGMDGQIYPNPYPTYYLSDYIAKVDKSGNVLWHKPIFANNRLIQNKPDIDEFGNVYYYLGINGKINLNGQETLFTTVTNQRDAALIKLAGMDGGTKYIDNLGLHESYLYEAGVSVLQNDIVSLSGNIDKQEQYIYPIRNHNGSNYYIATLGILPTPYLWPAEDYMLVTDIELPNNITDNTGQFDLITNVDWTATSSEDWLSLSSEAYPRQINSPVSISGFGDHKIILNAPQNETGITRIATITITGTNVSNKEIIVTQSATMGITEIREQGILVYPNPTTSYINFTQEIKSLKVFDMAGKLVLTAESVKLVDISKLQTGMYTVIITDDLGKTKSTKIIKK